MRPAQHRDLDDIALGRLLLQDRAEAVEFGLLDIDEEECWALFPAGLPVNSLRRLPSIRASATSRLRPSPSERVTAGVRAAGAVDVADGEPKCGRRHVGAAPGEEGDQHGHQPQQQEARCHGHQKDRRNTTVFGGKDGKCRKGGKRKRRLPRHRAMPEDLSPRNPARGRAPLPEPCGRGRVEGSRRRASPACRTRRQAAGLPDNRRGSGEIGRTPAR